MELALVSLGDCVADPHTNKRISQAEKLRLVVEHAVRGEQVGFHSVMLGEHHFTDYILSVPQMVLAAIAERTTTLRLNTGVTLLPTQDPVRLAEDFNTLDQLSGGRVEMTVGRGILVKTYVAAGVPASASRDAFAENLALLLALLEQESVTWSGTWRPPLEDIRIEPRSSQTPRFPVWVGGGVGFASVDLAARFGLHLMLPGVFGKASTFVPAATRFREQWEAHGHPGQPLVGNVFHVHVARTTQEARQRWAPYYRAYLGFVDSIWDGEGLFDGNGRAGLNFDVARLMETTAICGSPAEVVDRLGRVRDLLGLDLAALSMDLGGLPESILFDAIDLVGSDVIPQLPLGSATHGGAVR